MDATPQTIRRGRRFKHVFLRNTNCVHLCRALQICQSLPLPALGSPLASLLDLFGGTIAHYINFSYA